MNYNEWLEIIKLVEKTNRNKKYLEQMQNSMNNENINEMLKPKLIDLTTLKLNKAIKKIIYNLHEIFHNANTLDLAISSFRKDIQYIYAITNLKQIDKESQERLKKSVVEAEDKVYETLTKKSLEIDPSGMYKIIIEKTRNKKDDKYDI